MNMRERKACGFARWSCWIFRDPQTGWFFLDWLILGSSSKRILLEPSDLLISDCSWVFDLRPAEYGWTFSWSLILIISSQAQLKIWWILFVEKWTWTICSNIKGCTCEAFPWMEAILNHSDNSSFWMNVWRKSMMGHLNLTIKNLTLIVLLGGLAFVEGLGEVAFLRLTNFQNCPVTKILKLNVGFKPI